MRDFLDTPTSAPTEGEFAVAQEFVGRKLTDVDLSEKAETFFGEGVRQALLHPDLYRRLASTEA